MSRKQPVGQVRLTNIAIVRYKSKGLRFEIACFPNKVLDYRKKVEKDLANVLQSTNIFSNVGKGSFARRDDLLAAFGAMDNLSILRMILEKGELQVTERERQSEIASKTREIISFIAGMCVNSETKQPVSARVIEEGLKTASFQINLTQPIKQQAMKLFFVLAKTLPIERAKMKIQIACPAQYAKSVKTLLATYETEKGIKIINIVQTTHSIEFSVITDPGFLRPITDELTERTDGQGDISVVDLQVDTEDLLAAQNMNLDMSEDGEDATNPDHGEDDHFGANFGQAIDLENISAAFGTIKSHNTHNDPDDNDHNDDDQDESIPDLSQYLSPGVATKPSTKDLPPSKTKQPTFASNNYSDSDDDISFILSKTVTVIKEEDDTVAGGPHQVEKMVDFSGYGSTRKQKSLLDTIDYDNDDNNHDLYAINRRRQKTKAFGRFIGDGGDDDEFNQDGDDSENDEKQHQQHQQHQYQQLKSTKQTNTAPTSSSLSAFLHTNIAKSMVGTQIQPLGVAASIREDKSGRVVTKYDPESTLYREFMNIFDCQEDGFDDLPLLKQDHEVLQAIKRQIAFQHQHASDEFEWILELDEEEEEEGIGA